MRPLDVAHGADALLRGPCRIALGQLPDNCRRGEIEHAIEPQGPLSGQDNRALEDILELAHVTGPVGGQLADIDISATQVAGVAGFIYRPRLGNKVVLLTQADIGGGSAFTWSAGGGVEFLIKPWIGLVVAYDALRIDTGNVPKSGSGPVNELEYAVTQYGPAFSLTFHWSEK